MRRGGRWTCRGIAASFVVGLVALQGGACSSSPRTTGNGGASDDGGSNTAEGGGAGSDGATADTATPGDASAVDPAGFWLSYCALLDTCCTKLGTPFDPAQCAAGASKGIYPGTYDPVAGQACIDELRANTDYLMCTPHTGGAQYSVACDTLFAVWGKDDGTVAPGGTCTGDQDCKHSLQGEVLCRDYTAGTTSHVCQLLIRSKQGDGPCIETVSDRYEGFIDGATQPPHPAQGIACFTADGLYCDPTSAKCTPLPALGAACTTQWCAADGFCSSGTCAAPLPAGAGCGAYGATCVSGTNCDSASNVCSALAPDGGACTSSEACASANCRNDVCAVSSVAQACKLL